jgi:hypothetical protein
MNSGTPKYDDSKADRPARLESLIKLLRFERKFSDVAARRYRLAMWVLGRK